MLSPELYDRYVDQPKGRVSESSLEVILQMDIYIIHKSEIQKKTIKTDNFNLSFQKLHSHRQSCTLCIYIYIPPWYL